VLVECGSDPSVGSTPKHLPALLLTKSTTNNDHPRRHPGTMQSNIACIGSFMSRNQRQCRRLTGNGGGVGAASAGDDNVPTPIDELNTLAESRSSSILHASIGLSYD